MLAAKCGSGLGEKQTLTQVSYVIAR